MRNKLFKITMAVGFVSALAFTFSCSDDKDEGGSSSSVTGGENNSSSSIINGVGGSSSSVTGGENNSSSSIINGVGGSSSSGYGDGSSSSKVGCPDAEIGDNTLSCGGQTYKTVVIGSQTWMAENLNYKVNGSKCYDDIESNCTTYGRLYDWATATAVCPNGWHLSSNDEWEELTDFASGGEVWFFGGSLKATSGWSSKYNEDGNGTDDYGFSALPGGYYIPRDGFKDVGYAGHWWTSSEFELYKSNAYSWDIDDGYGYVTQSKSLLYSVRCVKD